MVRRHAVSLARVADVVLVKRGQDAIGSVWVEAWPDTADVGLIIGDGSDPIALPAGELWGYLITGNDRLGGVAVRVNVASDETVYIYSSTAEGPFDAVAPVDAPRPGGWGLK